jgi:Zn-dependent hydrolases, including glyoxylases
MKIKTIVVGDVQTNCYIIEHGGEYAVIDAGANAAEIIASLPAPPKYIFATHGHFDHVTAVPKLLAEYPAAKFYMHKADCVGLADKDGAGFAMFVPADEIGEINTYKDGDVFTLGGTEIRVIETPGHSKGSVTLMSENCLFSGDTLFFETCGRVDFPGGSMGDMRSSLKRLSALMGDFRVYPGHGPVTTLEHERANNIYMR